MPEIVERKWQSGDRVPMHRQRLKPGSKKLVCPALCAFDFETRGLGGEFLVAAIWTSDGHRELFTRLQDFFEWVLDHPWYRFLAHNAVGYEFAYIAPLLYDHFASRDNCSIEPTIQGDARIVQFRITYHEPAHGSEGQKRGRGRPRTKPAERIIDLRDTLCLFSMSLAKVADAFCPELPKLKEVIDFEKETWDIENPLHIEYVFRDCEIVLRAYQRHWQNIVEAFGVPLGVTAGSTALKAFKATIPEGHAYYRLRKEVEDFVREAYYGGLVLPGHSVGDWGATGSVDVNGAYAFQMGQHEFPIGTPFSTHRYHPDLVGFYRVRATVPNEIYTTLGFNPLPKKDKEGLSWPSGEFETYVTSPEIEYARKKGCTVEVIEGYAFTRTEKIFDQFVQTCQRMELAEGGAYKPSIKQIRNSGYGKFGSKDTHKTLKFSRERLYGYEPVLIEATGQEIPYLFVGDEVTDADYMMPHWAALITAYERLYLMGFMEECYARGARNVYCDTDSIKTDLPIIGDMLDRGILPTGPTYGNFKVEETCTHFILLGGKCFYGDTGDPDKPLMKAKGIPKYRLKPEVYLEAMRNERTELHFVSVKSVMSIIKERSHVQPIERKRKITDIRNSWAWSIDGEGRIWPRGYTFSDPATTQEGLSGEILYADKSA